MKHLDLVSIIVFILAIFMVYFFLGHEQKNTAVKIYNQYSLVASENNIATNVSDIPNVAEQNLYASLPFIASFNVYSIQTPFENHLLSQEPFLTHSIEVQEKQFVVTFYHPLILVFVSPIFWLFVVLYIISIIFIRERLQELLTNQLSEIEALENWVGLSRHEGISEPLSVNNKIADYISVMQAELAQARKGQSRFDQELRESALLDPKTRIGNRDFFTSHLDALLREEDSRGAVFLIYLKGCELVQNLYGENEALKLLEMAIESIKGRIINIPDCFLSRRSEFELAVLTPGLFVDDTEKLAERMIKNLTTLPLPIGVDKDEFCHFGISYFKSNNKLYQVMSEADMALRSAQLQGPSQWFMYDPGEIAKESAIGSLRWRTFLTQVIDKKQFIIFSQPVIDTKSHKTLHYEVLSKIKNNKGALISPRIFLPMAEKCGLAKQLDFIVFQQVCELIKCEAKEVSYSLNFSIEAILSLSFRKQVYATLAKYPNIARKIIIEISEYHLKSRLIELVPVIEELRKYQFRILADKVGQYIVNAQYLKQCHISYVKLHRSIVLDINIKPENQVFVQSMKVLCEPLGISLFAVGVENIEEWRALSKIGVCGGQGHYFNEPVVQLVNAND